MVSVAPTHREYFEFERILPDRCGYWGRIHYIGGGQFELQSGAQIALDPSEAFTPLRWPSYYRAWEILVQHYVQDKVSGYLNIPIIFPSASYLAYVVSAAPNSGPSRFIWKNHLGTPYTLKEIREGQGPVGLRDLLQNRSPSAIDVDELLERHGR